MTRSFDAVLVTSAWHWSEQPTATHEMACVLRDGGNFRFVLWNGFSRDVPKPWTPLVELREQPKDERKAALRGSAADLRRSRVSSSSSPRWESSGSGRARSMRSCHSSTRTPARSSAVMTSVARWSASCPWTPFEAVAVDGVGANFRWKVRGNRSRGDVLEINGG